MAGVSVRKERLVVRKKTKGAVAASEKRRPPVPHSSGRRRSAGNTRLKVKILNLDVCTLIDELPAKDQWMSTTSAETSKQRWERLL